MSLDGYNGGMNDDPFELGAEGRSGRSVHAREGGKGVSSPTAKACQYLLPEWEKDVMAWPRWLVTWLLRAHSGKNSPFRVRVKLAVKC